MIRASSSEAAEKLVFGVVLKGRTFRCAVQVLVFVIPNPFRGEGSALLSTARTFSAASAADSRR